MQNLRDDLNTAKERARGLKTKKAQAKAWTVVRDIEREILMGLYKEREAFAKFSIKGTVKHGSSGDDTFLVATAYGLMWLSPENDEASKSWYAHTCCVEYTEGQEVIIEMDVDVDGDRLSLHLVPGRIYGGTVNAEQYAELCKRDDLAFFKYPGTDGVTGLFKTKAVSNE